MLTVRKGISQCRPTLRTWYFHPLSYHDYAHEVRFIEYEKLAVAKRVIT